MEPETLATMRSLPAILGVIGVVCLPGIEPRIRANDVSQEDAARLKKAYRFEKHGWIYVHLEGSPEEVGYQHGSLLAREIAELLRVIKPFLETTTKRDWAF